jgi:predicted secreted protein
METHAFGFRLRANAPAGQKRFPITLKSKPRYRRDASEVRVQVGVSFVLELSADATAGYEWQLSRVPDVVVLDAERIQRASPGKPALD